MDGEFGSESFLADTVVKATTLLLIGLDICFSFRGNVVNIDGEGQILLGAFADFYVSMTTPNLTGLIMGLGMYFVAKNPVK